jgi:hypothetical protein
MSWRPRAFFEIDFSNFRFWNVCQEIKHQSQAFIGERKQHLHLFVARSIPLPATTMAALQYDGKLFPKYLEGFFGVFCVFLHICFGYFSTQKKSLIACVCLYV